MPRILRSRGNKSFRQENVSVPNADGARCERADIRGGLRQGPLTVNSGPHVPESHLPLYPPKADPSRTMLVVRFVPITEVGSG